MADRRFESLRESGDLPAANLAAPQGHVESGSPPSESFLAALARRPALVAVPLLAVIAFALRFRGYDRLSLWQDEGWTVSYARLPWPEVLGLRGQYDAHPPLYFAVAKLAATVLPESDAGRFVSVVAGTLTVVVLYALVARLANHLAAAGAGLILAIAPLHVWYSQEARMYALATLLVACSYLALVAFAGGGRGWWVIAYSLAVLLAMYVDYSALFPLVPQAVILLFLPRWYGRRVLWLWLAALLAALAFLPWMPQMLASLPEHATGRDWYLGVSLGKVADSVLAVVGLPGYTSYYWGAVATPWATLTNLRLGFVLAFAVAALAGTFALARRAPLALAVALALGPGTIITTALTSLAFPGYADRTVIYAVLGWAILAGSAPLVDAEPWHRQIAVASLTGVVVLTIAATLAVARDGQKQDYRAFAGAVRRVDVLGVPLLTDGRLTDTFLDLYGAEPPPNRRLNIYDPQVRDRLTGVEAVWFAYVPYAWNDHATWQAHLGETGFVRLGGQTIAHPGVPDPLRLDLYARPTARLGDVVPLPASLGADHQIPPGGTVEGDLRLDETTTDRPFLVSFAAQAENTTGPLVVTAGCLDDDGQATTAGAEWRIVEIGGDGSKTILAVRCPAGTAAVRLAWRNEGQQVLALRSLEVRAGEAR